MKKKCGFCAVEFKTENERAKYCSKDCRYDANQWNFYEKKKKEKQNGKKLSRIS